MRKVIIFITGFCAGTFVCALLILSLGVLSTQFSIQLYESEADQQRNLNLFVIASLVFGSVGGFLTLKRFAR